MEIDQISDADDSAHELQLEYRAVRKLLDRASGVYKIERAQIAENIEEQA